MVAAGCQSLLLLALLKTDDPWGGPVIFRITAGHGVHLYDVPLAIVWLVGVLCCGVLALERVPAEHAD